MPKCKYGTVSTLICVAVVRAGGLCSSAIKRLHAALPTNQIRGICSQQKTLITLVERYSPRLIEILGPHLDRFGADT
jgi:hypothetical protein